MVKAVEGKVGLSKAVEIWIELEVKKYGAGHPLAWDEKELSKKTWVNCETDADYLNASGYYKRLNNMIIKHFYNLSKQNNQEYPIFKRRNGKIGEMTNSLARIEVNRNIKLSGTTAVKAMDINKGKELKIDVQGRLIGDLMGKAKALGFDDRETAKLFIESQISAIKQIAMTPEEHRDLASEIASSIINTINQNPQITQQDQKHQNLFGKNDSLSTSNPNVQKSEDTNKPE